MRNRNGMRLAIVGNFIALIFSLVYFFGGDFEVVTYLFYYGVMMVLFAIYLEMIQDE